MAVDAFGDPNLFPAEMANMAFLLQDDTIDPVQWSAFPMMDFNGIMAKSGGNYENLPVNIKDNIQRQDFSVRDVEANFSLRMIEPRKSCAFTVHGA